MKRRIIAVAVLGAVGLAGCQTDTRVAGYSSETSPPSRVAQNPDPARGDRGPFIPGTVIADYEDTLIIRDDEGFERAMRVDASTVYRDDDGDIIAREYLEPGAQVRAAFDYNDKERIAREVIVVEDDPDEEPESWPEDPSPYRRDP